MRLGFSYFLATGLVDFDHAVDFTHEPETSKESNCACQNEEGKDYDAGVSKVQEGRGCAFDFQLGQEIMDTIDTKVESGETAGQKSAPPPVIVFSAEVEIAEQNSRLRASNDQDDKNQE